MTIEQVDLSRAAATYAVANTPLFLIRKLREDPAVSTIATEFPGDQTLTALKRAVEHYPPTDLCDYVRPYLYLVALSMKDTDAYLRKALELPNTKYWDWFNYVALALLQTYTPTQSQTVRASTPVFDTTASALKSDAPIEYEKVTS